MEIQYASVWEKNADAIPNEIALICGDNEVSWKDFDDRAAKLAALLAVSYTHLTLPTILRV